MSGGSSSRWILGGEERRCGYNNNLALTSLSERRLFFSMSLRRRRETLRTALKSLIPPQSKAMARSRHFPAGASARADIINQSAPESSVPPQSKAMARPRHFPAGDSARAGMINQRPSKSSIPIQSEAMARLRPFSAQASARAELRHRSPHQSIHPGNTHAGIIILPGRG